MSMVFFILFFMFLFFYFTSNQSEPGEINTKCINSLIILAEQGEDMKNICPWCINYINEKTLHCFLCGKCIKYQEFHDPYINNCVGRNNFSLYMSLLYFITINLSFKLVISIWGIFWLKGSNFKKSIFFIIIEIVATSACIVLIVKKIKSKKKIFNGLNFGNFFMNQRKENPNNNGNNTVSINNSIKNTTNPLPSFEETNRYA